MQKHCLHSMQRNRAFSQSSAPIFGIASGKCMQRGLVRNKIMKPQPNGSRRRLQPTISMPSILLPVCITADKVWSKAMNRRFTCTAALRNKGILTQIMKQQKCIGTGSEQRYSRNRRNSLSNPLFVVLPLWKSKVMTINCSTVWDKCCIREPERKKMRKLRQSIGKRPQSSEMSMLSMLWQSCGWKQTTEMYPKHCNG